MFQKRRGPITRPKTLQDGCKPGVFPRQQLHVWPVASPVQDHLLRLPGQTDPIPSSLFPIYIYIYMYLYFALAAFRGWFAAELEECRRERPAGRKGWAKGECQKSTTYIYIYTYNYRTVQTCMLYMSYVHVHMWIPTCKHINRRAQSRTQGLMLKVLRQAY